MTDKVYCYPPDYTVLENKLGIRDAGKLELTEREFVTERIAQGVPKGNFDLVHLQANHKQLFQDVFGWAGLVRRVEISKAGHQFQPRQYIETGMADVHRRIAGAGYLRGMDPAEFAQSAGKIIGDVNYVHPFREGNGRTQAQYLKQLAERAGHRLDLTKLEPALWIEASRQAHRGEYEPMVQAIRAALVE
jgi:cell filamentation protein